MRQTLRSYVDGLIDGLCRGLEAKYRADAAEAAGWRASIFLGIAVLVFVAGWGGLLIGALRYSQALSLTWVACLSLVMSELYYVTHRRLVARWWEARKG